MADLPDEVVERVAARFWAKVQKDEGCWLWTAHRNHRGYGIFNLNGRTSRAHRVAYTLTKGPIPDGAIVCHTCDNPPCCNPDHLWLGTLADNNRDKTCKGRNVRPIRDETAVNYIRGEDSNFAKLMEADVRAIRARRIAGDRTKDIAADYKIDRTLVWQICKGKVWSHVE